MAFSAEISALGGALLHKGHAEGAHEAAPVALVSVKSVYGHTEGAAGLTGVLAAAAAVSAAERPPVVNLAHLNPYVASAFEDWSIPQVLNAWLARSHLNPDVASAFEDVSVSQVHIASRSYQSFRPCYYWGLGCRV